jgi:catechol 2,3-dioxygenase-like lactoylglutathione lyase family enzyme
VRYQLGALLDHVHLRVRDLEVSRRFYRSSLAALGRELKGEGPDHFWVDELYVSADGPPTTGLHLAFQAADRAAVERFHSAALQAGGVDNGAPGERPCATGPGIAETLAGMRERKRVVAGGERGGARQSNSESTETVRRRVPNPGVVSGPVGSAGCVISQSRCTSSERKREVLP